MPSVQIKRLFGLFVIIGSLLASTFLSSGLFNPLPAYAAQPEIIEVDDGCYTENDGLSSTTTHRSPFDRTDNMCLGRDSDYSHNRMIYYQFAVTLPNQVDLAYVQGKNGNNDPIYFSKEADKLFVSTAGPTTSSGFSSYERGYAAQTISTCDVNDKNNKISITAFGTGSDKREINFNLCSYTNPSQALIYKSADLRGDAGEVASTGSLVGIFNVDRPETDESRDDDNRISPMQRDGITYMRLKKDGQVIQEDQNGQGDWFDLSDGYLSIRGLSPGEYEFVFTYDDLPVARTANPPYLWDPAEKFTLAFTKTVRAGDETWLTSRSGENYNSDDGVDPASLGVEEGDDEPVCSAGSFGWLLCPLIDGLANLNDTAFSIVQGLLQSNPLHDPSTGTDNDTYRIWGAMRDIANVVLVIGFIMIIFSQATSIGISNYGIKKLLPKLVAVAILINASWIVMQLATDLANILGSGLYQLLTALAPEINVDWGGFVAGVIGGGLAATGGFFAVSAAGGLAPAMWLILPPIIAGALALVVGVLTLFIRQALIIILVVISPIAIACFLLPGTEQWFKRWQKLLISMLMMYPLAALVFGAAQLAAGIITPETDMHSGYQLVALIILALPLFSLPWLAKQGGEILGKVNGALGKLASSANKPVGNWAKEKGELAKERSLARPAPRTAFGKRFTPRGHAINMDQRKRMRELELGAFKAQRSGTFSEGLAKEDVSKIPGIQNLPAAQAHVQSAIDKAREEQVSNAKVAMDRTAATQADRAAYYQAQLDDAMSKGDEVRTSAAARALFGMGGFGVGKIRSVVEKYDTSSDAKVVAARGALRTAVGANYGTATSAARDLAMWSGGNKTLAQHTDDATTWGQISDEELASQRPETFSAAFRHGAIDAARAQHMLDDNNIKKSEPLRAALRRIIDGGEPYPKEESVVAQGIEVNAEGELTIPRENQPPQAPSTPPRPFIDDQGRQTPGNIGDSDDYHDGMQR